jgi:hypothetical protein
MASAVSTAAAGPAAGCASTPEAARGGGGAARGDGGGADAGADRGDCGCDSETIDGREGGGDIDDGVAGGRLRKQRTTPPDASPHVRDARRAALVALFKRSTRALFYDLLPKCLHTLK